VTAAVKKTVGQNIQKYKAVISQLDKEAEKCVRQLQRVEELQTEKVKRFEAFYHNKELGKKLLERLAL